MKFLKTLVSAATICSNLKLSTEDKTDAVTVAQAMDVIKSVGHNLNKLFIPTSTEEQASEPPPKKWKPYKEPGETRQLPSKFTSLHCPCGILFQTDDALVYHQKQSHKLNNN